MGVWVSVKQAGRALQKLRLSLGPDSYFRYRRDRDDELKRAAQTRTDTTDSARRAEEQRHGADRAVERERGYHERYASERAERPDQSDGA